MDRPRLDKVLVDLGLAPTRERARALIMAGDVVVDGHRADKAGASVRPGAEIRLKGQGCPFVSRGGIKLAGALDDFGIDVTGLTVLDVGASTGGFTDCVLRRGAARVFAIDVGTNQLDWSLRRDPRVFCLERTNARDLAPDMLPGLADLAVIDVSFISLAKILPAVVSCISPAAEILALVKPQFEVGRGRVGKGGVVRDPEAREDAVRGVIEAARSLGLALVGRADSRIRGPRGNQEIFVRLVRRP